MKKPIKILLIVIFAILISLFLLHVTVNNILPFISQMHSGSF